MCLAIIVRELVLISENGEVVVRVGAATWDTVLLSIYRLFASTSINERYLRCQIYNLYKDLRMAHWMTSENLHQYKSIPRSNARIGLEPTELLPR